MNCNAVDLEDHSAVRAAECCLLVYGGDDDSADVSLHSVPVRHPFEAERTLCSAADNTVHHERHVSSWRRFTLDRHTRVCIDSTVNCSSEAARNSKMVPLGKRGGGQQIGPQLRYIEGQL